MKREIELFKSCFNISMEKILQEEKSLKTTIYSISHTTKFCELLVLITISKHTAQYLTSCMSPVTALQDIWWKTKAPTKFVFLQINPRYFFKHVHSPICSSVPRRAELSAPGNTLADPHCVLRELIGNGSQKAKVHTGKTHLHHPPSNNAPCSEFISPGVFLCHVVPAAW